MNRTDKLMLILAAVAVIVLVAISGLLLKKAFDDDDAQGTMMVPVSELTNIVVGDLGDTGEVDLALNSNFDRVSYLRYSD